MSWYSIDAVNVAIKRTRKALIEPFDFWKWIKLGIISILIGGGGNPGFNYNMGSFNQPSVEKERAAPSIHEIFDQISQFWHQYETYILIAAAVVVFMILLFTLISSIMEFVLVDSLVTNIVTIRAYFRKYLHPGFNLFIVRMVLLIVFLSLFILAILPIVLPFLKSPETVTFGMVLVSILWFLVVMLTLALVSGVINSFINLSIPVAMYHETGIIEAIRKILEKFREDWKQIIVYWVVRFILGLVAGIIVGIVALILFIVIFGPIFLMGLTFYFILSGIGLGTGNPLFWVVIIPYGLVALILFILFILMASVPVPVFMKYHMLTFLQSWYEDARIPFFDAKENEDIRPFQN